MDETIKLFVVKIEKKLGLKILCNKYKRKMDKNLNYIDEIKKVLPKNMKKTKVNHIENIINQILKKIMLNIDEEDKYNEKIKELKRENTQLKLDNLRIHEENKIINKLHEIILKLDNDNKELRESNDELIKIAEEFEKININNTVGIYKEE